MIPVKVQKITYYHPNRSYAVILKENGYVVHLEDHGIVRDCVAEYAIYTHASGYKGGTHPVSEDK